MTVSVHSIPLAHAKLSASGAHTWMVCTASAWAGAQFEDEGSAFADEGTRAHGIGSDCLARDIDVTDWYRWKFGCGPDDVEAELAELYPLEMAECVQDYIDYVRDEIALARARNSDAIVYIEQRVDFSPWVREGFGTGDCIIISDGLIRVIDYKHGKGVFVDVTDNEQLMLYGLGAWHMFRHLFDVTALALTIYQPRINNIKTYDISIEQLLNWADHTVKPVAAKVWYALETGDLADVEFNPKDEDVCRFCKARHHCRARADEALDMAKYTRETALLTDAEVGRLLPQVSMLKKWANDLSAWSQAQAVRGKKFEGHKLVEGRSTRKYRDAGAVQTTLLLEGYTAAQIHHPPKLIGVTDMTKLLKGKKAFDVLLGQLVTKPRGRPVLVAEDDPRPELVESTAATDQGFE